MKYELKQCPFCGGEFDLEEEWNRNYIKECVQERRGYAIGARCSGCGLSIMLHDTDLVNPLDPDEAIENLAKKVNRRIQYEKHPTVYVAGAIKNDPDYKEKFATVAAYFREKGYDVINPAETVLDQYASYKDYIDHGLAQAMTADLFCMITIKDNFIKSCGMDLERKYAETVGTPVIIATYDQDTKEVTLE